ncbi:Wzz/FepE/Etk N-terminal domain-containing protein [Vibrio splendidus]
MKQQTQPKPYSPHNPPVFIPSKEIDLRDVFKVLWDGRLVILLVTALFSLISVGFALTAQEWWSSKAKVTEAQPQDLTEYHQQVKQFQPVFNIYQDDGTVLVSKELNKLVDPEVLFQRFVSTFNSANNKRDFLDNSAEFQEFKATLSAEDSEMTEDTARALYLQWFERIAASVSDKKDRNSPYFVSFQTVSKQSSFDLLTSYMAVTEAKVHQDAFNNLRAVISGKRNELIQQKRILETQAQNQLLIEVERTKYAVAIAIAAGVEKPIQTGNRSEIFEIDLGSKGLEAKVKALESVKNLSVIEPRLQQINAKLDMLSNLKIDRSIEFKTFRFLDNVEQPITRDKPKRVLIVFFGVLLGGVLGLIIVAIRFAFRKQD